MFIHRHYTMKEQKKTPGIIVYTEIPNIQDVEEEEEEEEATLRYINGSYLQIEQWNSII